MPSVNNLSTLSRERTTPQDGRRFTLTRAVAVLAALALGLAAALLFGLTVGSTSVGVMDLLFPSSVAAEPVTILLSVRLPRVMLAAAVGACLSAAGVAFQALL